MERIRQKTNYSIIFYTIIIDIYLIAFFNAIMDIQSIPLNIRQLLVYILVLCAVWECVRNVFTANGNISKATVLAIFYLAYVVIGCFVNKLDAQTILSYVFFPISFILFFESSKRTNRYTNLDVIQNIQFILFCYFAILFFIQKVVLGGTSRSDINSVYYIITLLPIVVNSKHKYIHVLSLLISIFLSIVTLKLGACLCIMAVFIVYYVKNNSKQKVFKVLKYAIIILLVFILTNAIAKNLFNFDIMDKLQASSNSGGSGRLELWSETGKLILNQDIAEKLFGNFYGTSKDALSGFSAHNDFLEAIWRIGIVGFLILICLIYNLFKIFKKGKICGCIPNTEPLIVMLIMMTVSQLLFIPAYVGFLGMGIGIYAAQCINTVQCQRIQRL